MKIFPTTVRLLAGLSGVGLSQRLELVDAGIRVETESRDETWTGDCPGDAGSVPSMAPALSLGKMKMDQPFRFFVPLF